MPKCKDGYFLLSFFNALFRKTDTGLIKSDNSNDRDALLSQFSKLVK